VLIDAHVHLFPRRLAQAVWDWFDANLWHVEHRFGPEECVEELTRGGVDRLVALPYAHKPGVAEPLNRFTAELMKNSAAVLGCGTVFPGEFDAERILADALGPLGLRGIKIHCHVMKISPDDKALDPVYRAAIAHNRPVVIHAGREPASPAYGLDVHKVSGAVRIRRVLDRFPDLTLVVPHLGADEFEAFESLLADHPRLHMDTTMAISGYFPTKANPEMLRRWPERILYGTDFPNLPYPWDRELKVIRGLGLEPAAESKILGENALRLFGE
jgi:predicted TIM-barrel fold metal-dependent hydrolase